MSGECEKCGEHAVDCKCNVRIAIWAQMFFCDGSVSQGLRVLHTILDSEQMQDDTAKYILKDLGRTEGLLLLWGAGMMKGIAYPKRLISFCLLEESET